MLRPQDTATPRAQDAERPVGFRLDAPARAGPRSGCTAPAGRTRRRWPCRPATTTSPPTRPCATTSATSGTRPTVRVPRGWDGQRVVLHFESATHRATVVGRRHRGGLATRAATRRSRPTSPSTSRPASEARITVVVNNTLSFQPIPPGVVEDTPDGRGSGTGTTSSTTPACTGRCGCTRPRRAHLDRRHRRHRPRRRHRHRRVPDRGRRRRRRRGPGGAARRRRRRGRHRRRRRAAR